MRRRIFKTRKFQNTMPGEMQKNIMSVTFYVNKKGKKNKHKN